MVERTITISRAENGWVVNYGGRTWIADTTFGVERVVSEIILGLYDENKEQKNEEV